MRGYKLAGWLLSGLARVLEAGIYLDLFCSGAGLAWALEAFWAAYPSAVWPGPPLPPCARPPLRTRARRRRGLPLPN